MKQLDKLLQLARAMLAETAKAMFSGNEDGFIDALGVEPRAYAVKQPDDTIGYDVMRALNDVAAKCWREGERMK